MCYISGISPSNLQKYCSLPFQNKRSYFWCRSLLDLRVSAACLLSTQFPAFSIKNTFACKPTITRTAVTTAIALGPQKTVILLQSNIPGETKQVVQPSVLLWCKYLNYGKRTYTSPNTHRRLSFLRRHFECFLEETQSIPMLRAQFFLKKILLVFFFFHQHAGLHWA